MSNGLFVCWRAFNHTTVVFLHNDLKSLPNIFFFESFYDLRALWPLSCSHAKGWSLVLVLLWRWKWWEQGRTWSIWSLHIFRLSRRTWLYFVSFYFFPWVILAHTQTRLHSSSILFLPFPPSVYVRVCLPAYVPLSPLTYTYRHTRTSLS